MWVEQKETWKNSQNLWELVNQYKQIEISFNSRIAEIVKSVLPKDFDMSKISGLDRVFQELNSPQNLRKEWTLHILTNHYQCDEKELFSALFNGLDGRLFDERIGIEVSKMANTITISVLILPENIETHKVEIAVSDMVSSVDWILKN